jgi:hypothetical protein
MNRLLIEPASVIELSPSAIELVEITTARSAR